MLMVSQLVEILNAFMKPEPSLPCSQQQYMDSICRYSDPKSPPNLPVGGPSCLFLQRFFCQNSVCISFLFLICYGAV
jgi:hypothetical protein